MTEPVARPSARRTVRLAVALVAGQALLCAVIGWVTLGGSHEHQPVAPIPPVEPLAAKPLVRPPVVAPPPRPSAPAAPSTKAKVRAFRSTRKSPPPAPPVPKTRSVPVKPDSKPVPPGLSLPTSKPATEVQSPVELEDVCDPVDAKGLTADGVSVDCVKGDDGVLRWQIN